MSGYEGQETARQPDTIRKVEENMLAVYEGEALLLQAIDRPGGAEERFILGAIDKRWKIGFHKHGMQVPGYDEAVERMWSLEGSNNIVEVAYAKLIAHSLGFSIEGDGK